MTEVVFRLPDVGEGLAEAEVVEWLVEAGATVRADQPVVTVETAKAQVELPAPADGVVRELRSAPGDVVPVGEPLFVLETTPAGAEPVAAHHAGPAAAPRTPGRRRVLAAPSTRRLAVELGVDLAEMAGTGPNGRVVPDDVRGALAARTAETPPPSPAAPPAAAAPAAAPAAAALPAAGDRAGDTVRPLRGLRRQIARTMTATLAIPHITEFREVDATELERAHATLRADAAERGARLTLLPLLVRATITALRRHPELNASLDMGREELTVHARIDIGIATATPDGLIVPVLRDAGRRGIPALGHEIARLADAARRRDLTPRETTGGTFTISNFGSYGTWLGTPLINPPQVAIAGFGRVRDAVVPVDGAPAVRRMLPLAVAADHRVVDGADLGAFVDTLERLLRTPLLMLGEDR